MNRKTFLMAAILFAISLSAYPADLIVNVADPNGTDDTAAIQAALNQCLAPGPVCTVQLAAGTYLIKQLFTENFHGTFKGKGMDVTILQALPNLPVSQEQPVWNSPPSVNNPYPMLVLFFGGDITVSDMTIRALEPNPLEGWYEYAGQLPITAMWGILEFMGQSEEMNVFVTRAALEGKYDESQPASDHYNATGFSIDPYPPYVFPPPGHLSGTFRVSACRFDTLFEAIYGAVLHEARITIGGSPSEANLIQNCDWGAVLVDLDSSLVKFSYNDVSVVGSSAFAGFGAGQRIVGPIETPSSFLVQHNRIKATGSYEDGILILDLAPLNGEKKTGDFVISNNTIIIEPSEASPAFAGIQSGFTEGTVIANNRIVGSGLFGILLDGDTQAMVKGNNVNGVAAEVAPIGLTANTTNSTVVGFGKETNVLDEGISNTLVGVNNMQGNSPGPVIRDAMKRKMDAIKSLGRR